MKKPHPLYFPGGADISPELYGEVNNGLSHCSPNDDAADLEMYERAKRDKIPCFGICRGAQFLWAMSGGKLLQHIENGHPYHHPVSHNTFIVNSLHHQGIILDADGNPPKGLTVIDMFGGVVEAYEGVNRDGVRIVAVQYHPEMMHGYEEARNWFFSRVSKL